MSHAKKFRHPGMIVYLFYSWPNDKTTNCIIAIYSILKIMFFLTYRKPIRPLALIIFLNDGKGIISQVEYTPWALFISKELGIV